MANRFTIGMTGGIGSGKSAAARLFEKHGFYTIDADILARQATLPYGKAYKDIVDFFGKEILEENGEINRKLLGSMVFADEQKRLKLESITHPVIWQLEKKLRGEILGKDSKALIITHAALLAETGAYKNFHPLITVYCSRDTQIRRITKRDGISEKDALLRINSQLPMEKKLELAHIIINNDTDNISELEREVLRAAELIKLMQYGLNH